LGSAVNPISRHTISRNAISRNALASGPINHNALRSGSITRNAWASDSIRDRIKKPWANALRLIARRLMELAATRAEHKRVSCPKNVLYSKSPFSLRSPVKKLAQAAKI